MKKMNFFGLLAMSSVLFLTACNKDDEGTTPTPDNLNLNITGLQNLGSDYQYENWLIVDGAAVSAGVFTVDDMGNLSKSSFSVGSSDLNSATTYVLTIEPIPDSDPNPSKVHILGGDFSGSNASLTIGHPAALGSDFTSSTGGYILATPTDGGMTTDENSGVWWLNPATSQPGLDLPDLPDGWVYEGWAVIDGMPYSTGTFSALDAKDNAAPYSEVVATGPPFPGEDFLLNAPVGLTFPLDLSGKVVVISVEPSPDNSADPFVLKPLVGQVPANALDHTFYDMDNNAANTNPTGTATK